MNEEQTMNIIKHGQDLLAIFPNATEKNPLKLCRRLRRIENRVTEATTAFCNGTRSQESMDGVCNLALYRLELLLNHGVVPIVINRDPRGYALKIDSDWVRDNQPKIERDWGGYGLIAPEIK